jgi:hypothetical protein
MSNEATWSVWYGGCYFTGIRADTIRIPATYDHAEAHWLESLGYTVAKGLDGVREVIITRPRLEHDEA